MQDTQRKTVIARDWEDLSSSEINNILICIINTSKMPIVKYRITLEQI